MVLWRHTFIAHEAEHAPGLHAVQHGRAGRGIKRRKPLDAEQPKQPRLQCDAVGESQNRPEARKGEREHLPIDCTCSTVIHVRPQTFVRVVVLTIPDRIENAKKNVGETF
jgi:hypothetical protein